MTTRRNAGRHAPTPLALLALLALAAGCSQLVKPAEDTPLTALAFAREGAHVIAIVKDKRCRLEARVASRQPVSVTADGDKMATAFMDAVDKLIRALDTDLGRVKDRNGRDTIRNAADQGD